MFYKSFTFSHAITCQPSRSIIDGLRAVDTGVPDLTIFRQHHQHYIAALKQTGAKVIELDPLEEFPDSVFVEDSALCLQEGAIIMRPGAPSRLGEAAAMRPHLDKFYREVVTIEGRADKGFIEGGDILVTEREILVGRSARTDSEGIEELRALVSCWGYEVREVFTPPDVLHFKTDCSLLDENTILATKRLAATRCFEGYEVIHTAEGEEACANAIRFNELVIMPEGFPKTASLIRERGYSIYEIENTQAAKLDGGMSCLSLRFSPIG